MNSSIFRLHKSKASDFPIKDSNTAPAPPAPAPPAPAPPAPAPPAPAPPAPAPPAPSQPAPAPVDYLSSVPQDKLYQTFQYTLKSDPSKDCSDETNCRSLFVIYPDESKYKMPDDGWPYFMYFSFLNRDGSAPDDENVPGNLAQYSTLDAGIMDLDIINEYYLQNKSNKDVMHSLSNIWIQLLFQLLLNSGIAIVFLTNIEYDYWYARDCTEEQITSKEFLCWNGSGGDYNNLFNDKEYLMKTFDFISDLGQKDYNFVKDYYQEKYIDFTELEKGNYVDSVSTCLNIDFNKQTINKSRKINYNKLGLIGYSAGAQLVSRCINEFPFMKTYTNTPFPAINVAVMIGGASYHCYEYCDGSKLTKDKCKTQPEDIYGDCSNKDMGCCPITLTESNYDNNILQWKTHPPVILAQTKCDEYADSNGSLYYYKNLESHGVPTQLVRSLGNIHNLCPRAIIPILNFVLKYL